MAKRDYYDVLGVNKNATPEQIKSNYEDIINLLGEDKLREGLLKTPERASKAMKFLTEGYEKDPKQIFWL